MSVNPPYGGPPGPPPGSPPSYPPPPPSYQPDPYAQQHQPYGQGSAPPPPAKKNWLLWVGAGCGCLLLGAAVIAGVIFMGVKAGTAGAEAVVKDFLEAAGEERYAEAYDHFSAPLKETQSYEDFVQSATENPHFFKVKDTTFNQRSVDTTSAKLAGSVTLESGTELPSEFRLVQENGAWKLIAYHIGKSD